MSKRIVHYINQFFAGIGGEEKADIAPEVREGIVGPGLAFKTALGEGYEIVATVICGDNYFGSNIEKGVVPELLKLIGQYKPDGFIAGPAFNAGRYGVACGTIAKAVQDELGIPVVTGMYVENPGADMFKKDVHIIATKDSSADMRKSAPKMAALLKKKLAGEEILGPAEEGYMERGIRVNYFNERRGSERAVELIVKKIKGEEVYTDYPMPKVLISDKMDPKAAQIFRERGVEVDEITGKTPDELKAMIGLGSKAPAPKPAPAKQPEKAAEPKDAAMPAVVFAAAKDLPAGAA